MIHRRMTAARRASAVLAAAALFLVTGCGNATTATTATTTAAGGGDQGSACAAGARDKVEAALEPIEFVPPRQPVDMAANQGKSVWYIAPDLSLPFIAAIAEGFEQGARAAGMEPTVFDGKGNVNTFNQGVTAAVTRGADGILLQGINPALVSGPLAQAAEQGIVVVDSLNGGPDQPLEGGVKAHVTVDYRAGGELMADYALAESGCTGDLLFFTSSIYTVYVDMLAGFTDEIARLCPTCAEPEVIDVAPTDLATKLGPLTTTALTRHPTARYFVAAYDGMVQFMTPSLQEASSEVKIVSHDGVVANLQQIRAGSAQTATVSNPPNQAMGWAEVDQLGRLLAGQEPVTPELPQQLFVAGNIAADEADLFPGYAGYQDEYQQLWGIT